MAAFSDDSDDVNMTGASVSLVQGSRYVWASDLPISSSTQVLADPTGSYRTAAIYYDPNAIAVQISFTSAFSGNLERYAMDYDNEGRTEEITVDGQSVNLSNFSRGDWGTFPITQAANSTVTITVTNTGPGQGRALRHPPQLVGSSIGRSTWSL